MALLATKVWYLPVLPEEILAKYKKKTEKIETYSIQDHHFYRRVDQYVYCLMLFAKC